MSRTICADCRQEVINGTICPCQNQCKSRDCQLYVPGAIHRKGSVLCKFEGGEI